MTGTPAVAQPVMFVCWTVISKATNGMKSLTSKPSNLRSTKFDADDDCCVRMVTSKIALCLLCRVYAVSTPMHPLPCGQVGVKLILEQPMACATDGFHCIHRGIFVSYRCSDASHTNSVRVRVVRRLPAEVYV